MKVREFFRRESTPPMQALTELCLNKIEESGADTRELTELNTELPKRMWTRHPILKVTGQYFIDLGVDSNGEMLSTNIEISYTGVYTMRCDIQLSRYEHTSDEMIKKAYLSAGLDGPIQYEKKFESPEGELPKEQADWFSERRGPGNLVSAEIIYMLLAKGRSYHVELSFEGPAKLSLGEWDDEVDDFWFTIEPNISRALEFMKVYVSI